MTSRIELEQWIREQAQWQAQGEALKVLYNKHGVPIQPKNLFPPKEGRKPGPGARLPKA